MARRRGDSLLLIQGVCVFVNLKLGVGGDGDSVGGMRFLVLRGLAESRGLRSLLALIRVSDFGAVLFSPLGELGLLWFLLVLCFRWKLEPCFVRRRSGQFRANSLS